ncbi:hypothetical protein EsH8_X_000208 [Colletotrichum jinshuiense]
MILWRFLSVVFVLGFIERTQALSFTGNPVRRVDTVKHIEWSTNPDTNNVDADHDIILSLSENPKKIRFQISPNADILSRNLNVQHVQQSGSYQPFRQPQQAPSTVYKGSAFLKEEKDTQWTKAGWARLAYRKREGQHLLEGAFRLHGEYYHIALDSTYRQTSLPGDPKIPQKDAPYLIVWRDSDIVPDHPHGGLLGRSADGPLCGTDQYNHSVNDVSARQLGQPSFDPFDTIGSTQGCPTTRRVALLGVATDCTYTSAFSSIQDARDNIISQINVASQVYEDTFNIGLAIQNLTISDSSCPATETSSTPWNVACTGGFDISSRLNTFSAWRGQFNDGNAIWTLLSACNSGQVVGIAWLGSVCSRGSRSQGRGGNAQTFASTNVVVRTRAEWQVIAHEIGHNFGAVHDCTSSECGSGSARGSGNCCSLSTSTCDAGGQYLMNPSTGRDISDFSACSIGTICTGIGRNAIDTSCFVSAEDAPDINESECGNGIVEGSEECDCGGVENCPADSCCNPTTCQLRENAACDPTNDLCCTDSCRIASSGFVCRNSTGTCDPQETCNGSSAQCPTDAFQPDGESCGGGDGFACASGLCTSRNSQCANAYNETLSEVQACDNNSCQLYCNIPGQGCSRASQDFIDGTPCGNGGMCRTGSCERAGSGGGGGNGGGGGGNNGSGAQDWFDRNRNVVIGAASGVGGLIVIIIIVSCIVRSLRKKKGAKMLTKRWPQGPPSMAQPAQPPHPLMPSPDQYPPQPPSTRVRYA